MASAATVEHEKATKVNFGMSITTVTIDCHGVDSMAMFWDRYVEAVGMENCIHFGRNLDALWDALSGGGPGWPEVDRLVFSNSKDLLKIADGQGAILLQKLREMTGPLAHLELELD